MARLDRLSATREGAQIGSAIGREFDYQLLAAVAGLPEVQLQAALSQLEAAGLIFRRGSPPEAVYAFKHALVQDTAHDSLLKSRRQQLHARIAEAIEQRYPEIASAQPQVGVLVWALFWASFCCLVERDFERARAFADRTFALSNQHGFGFWAAAGQASLGATLVIADSSRAVAMIRNALAKLQGMPTWQPHYLCFRAEALLRLNQVAEARAAVDRALAITASGGVTWWDAELHRIRAAVIRAEGGSDTAGREALARAVAIAEEQGSETFRRRAAADLAALDAKDR